MCNNIMCTLRFRGYPLEGHEIVAFFVAHPRNATWMSLAPSTVLPNVQLRTSQRVRMTD